MSGERRNFLGWDGPFLPRAARALIESRRGREGASALDFSACVVVLPGRRAARRFEELCAALAGDAWIPPRFVTEGALPDVLAREPLATLAPLGRTLAWSAALRALPESSASLLFAGAPEERTFEGELALARQLARLHSTLAAEGLVCGHVAARSELFGSPRDAERWRVLAGLEIAYETALAGFGKVDPAQAASELVRRGLVRDDVEVWLVAVLDLGRAQRALLARVPKVTSLVFAPAELAPSFDEWGTLIPSAWAERDLPLARKSWRVVSSADEQARGAVQWLRELGASRAADGLRPEDATIGALDPALVPHLERRLAEVELETHWAGGTPIERALPVRLLGAVLEFVRTRGWPELAALMRHPDLEVALARRVGSDVDVPTALDRYFNEHLPAHATESPLAGPASVELARAQSALDELLGGLASTSRAPLRVWSVEIERFLTAIHPELELEPQGLAGRQTNEALERIATVLAEMRELAGTALEPRSLSAVEALELALDRLARESLAAPASAGAIEIVGTLELLLDDAPHLLLAGWNEGHLPSSAPGDLLLPDALRRALGLPDAEHRLARDVYSAEAILRSRESVLAQSSRRGADGEPARPSRLTFRCPAEEALERVKLFFERAAEETTRAASPSERRPPAKLAFGARPPVTRMRATAFKTYLASPYLFYLQHVLGLETRDDAAREMDPLAFGILAHEVLQHFGASALRDSRDEAAIAGFLSRALDERAFAKFGADALPAVGLQVEQLRARLAGFAHWQASRAADGWRIVETELECELALDVDGEPMRVTGTIDRIDRHPERGWCVLDYKTGEAGEKPDKAHRRNDEWIDLQLPLYRAMVRERCPGNVQLGYVVLPRQAWKCRAELASWDEVLLDDALDLARAVVRGVRSGEFGERGDRAPRERVFAALAGFDLLGEDDPDDPDEAAENGEEGA